MNINFYLYVYQHIISIYIFHQQKKQLLPKTKKFCAQIISSIIRAQNYSLFLWKDRGLFFTITKY